MSLLYNRYTCALVFRACVFVTSMECVVLECGDVYCLCIGSDARSDGTGSVDSFDSDEELSVGEEGSLKIDWEGWLHGFQLVCSMCSSTGVQCVGGLSM